MWPLRDEIKSEALDATIRVVHWLSWVVLVVILLVVYAKCLRADEVVVPLPRHRPARVIFVVDVSGSINGDQLAQELGHVRRTLRELPFDGAEWTVVAFGAIATVYGQWIRHPSPQGEKDALAWLGTRPAPDDATSFASALNHVVALAGSKPTTVVWLSDGAPNLRDQRHIAASLQVRNPTVNVDGRRCLNVSWVFVGIGLNEYTRALMRECAQAVGGGLVEIKDTQPAAPRR